MEGLKVQLLVKQVAPYKGAKHKDERVVSLTVKPDPKSWHQHTFMKRLATALEEGFTTLRIDANGGIVITRIVKAK